jgi:uncharacterized membrane protein
MSYELSEISGNLIDGDNWERIGKFMVTNVVLGVAISIILSLIMYLLSDISMPLVILLMIGIILTGQAFILSWYEQWRGCHFKKNETD